MPDLPEPRVTATRYEVSLLSDDDINRHYFALYVEARDDDRWAVADGFQQCLAADGTWSHESVPSERADDWLADHRFDLVGALFLAKQAVPKVTVNGFTVTDALAMHKRHATTDGSAS